MLLFPIKCPYYRGNVEDQLKRRQWRIIDERASSECRSAAQIPGGRHCMNMPHEQRLKEEQKQAAERIQRPETTCLEDELPNLMHGTNQAEPCTRCYLTC